MRRMISRIVKGGNRPFVLTSPVDTDGNTIVSRAVEVIGDEARAMRWLGTPVRALDYATPISLLHMPQGREAVLTVLGRLEHGVM